MRRDWLVIVAGVWVVAASPSEAVIERLMPLSEVIGNSTRIVTVKVDKIDAKRPSVVLVLDQTLKGKNAAKTLPMLVQGDAGAKKRKESAKLLARLAVMLPVVLFIEEKSDRLTALGYTNGTWFTALGVKAGKNVVWKFMHLEPYLRRTYKGTTAAMVRTVRDVVAKKKKAPPVDEKEKPGLGPEVKKVSDASQTRSSRATLLRSVANADPAPPRLAVIPAVLVGGPLALLAMMFPTVFGGWKRWLVLLSTAATNSTLYALHYWFADDLLGTWWGTPQALWTAMLLVNAWGLIWAWNRHLASVETGDAPLVPGGVELIVLALLSVISAAFVVTLHVLEQPLLTPAWLPMLGFAGGVWVGMAYAGWVRWRGPRLRPAWATEAVVLTGVVVAGVLLGATLRPARALAGGVEAGEEQETGGVRHLWTFQLPDKGDIVSSPLVAGDRVYVAAAIGGSAPSGAVYCLNRATGKVVWTFNAELEMKPVFSSPVLIDGKLYIGEGFHQDRDCRIFCLDAKTGTQEWEFLTDSHTESTPFVANGRVYCGAGDGGLFCLKVREKGKVAWNFPGFHIDAGPVVSDGRVYVGCGIGDAFRQTAMVCLDANSGRRHWVVDTKLPVWSRAVVSKGRVFVGTGNGRVNQPAAEPAGAVLCLRAGDGKRLWRYGLPDGVLGRIGADRRRVYFGCRDGWFYALRRDGKLAWKRNLGMPIVSGPAMNVCPTTEMPAPRMYVLSFGGTLMCLEPATGKLRWTRELADELQAPVEAIATPALEERAEGDGRVTRRLYVAVTAVTGARLGQLRCYEDATEGE